MFDIGINSGKTGQGCAHPQMLFRLERRRVVEAAQPEIKEVGIIAVPPGKA